MPNESEYDVDWIIANHSDELTPWVNFFGYLLDILRYFWIFMNIC
jgi:hypothetical protein